jgi:Protein of unknown function (DUF3631)
MNRILHRRHWIYGEQLRPPLDSPKAKAPLQAPAPHLPSEHSVKLLAAFREIFEARAANQISTKDLLDALRKRAGDEPWAVWWKGDPAKNNIRGPARKLAHYLKPFAIAAHTIREPDGTTPKGYKLQYFEAAFSRYLPPKPHLDATTPLAHE